MVVLFLVLKEISVLEDLLKFICVQAKCGLPQWLSGKESACGAGDTGLIPELERDPGQGNGNPLQYSC